MNGRPCFGRSQDDVAVGRKDRGSFDGVGPEVPRMECMGAED